MVGTTSGSRADKPCSRIRKTALTEFQIVFYLCVFRRIGPTSADKNSAIETSLNVFRNDLVEQIRRKATEATIDVSELEGQAYSFKFNVVCRLKNPAHDYVVRRMITNSLGTQESFYTAANTKIKVNQTTLDAVRQSYESHPPGGSRRWLHLSIVRSKAHDMQMAEFVEEFGKTVKREESNLLDCETRDQFKEDAWAKQTLLHSVHQVLVAKISGQQKAPEGMDPDVVQTAAPPYLPSKASSTTMRRATTGALHPISAETTGTTPQMGRQVGSETIAESETGVDAAAPRRRNLSAHFELTGDSPAPQRRNLSSSFELTGDAPAPSPVETTVHCESPSGDSQARDAIITAIEGQEGITASQLCVGCHEADLHCVVSGAKKRRRRNRHRAGRRHRKASMSTVESQLASTEGSLESTPEKKKPDRVRPACASTTQAVETVAKGANQSKRQRSGSPVRQPTGGLTLEDFGDVGREYKADLERASSVYESAKALQNPGGSRSERKYLNVPTSYGISSWATRNRQENTKGLRQKYQTLCASNHCEHQNQCASKHCEHQLINNPWSSARKCCRPSAGDLLGRGADL